MVDDGLGPIDQTAATMAPAVAELAILRRTREPLVEPAAGKDRAPLDGHVVRREEARVGRVGVVVGVDRVDDRLARRSEGVAGQRIDRPAADHRARNRSQAVDERDDRSFVERTVVVGEHDVAPARPGDAEVPSGPRPAVGLANQDGSDRLAERLDDPARVAPSRRRRRPRPRSARARARRRPTRDTARAGTVGCASG